MIFLVAVPLLFMAFTAQRLHLPRLAAAVAVMSVLLLVTVIHIYLHVL